MDGEAYHKHVDYRFIANGEWFAVTPLENSGEQQYVCVEETRKNGQEDCHMSGYLVRENGVWEWDESEGGSDSIDTYSGESTSKAIVDYLNKHPHPDLVSN